MHQSKLGKTKITLVDFVRDRFNIGNQKIVQQPEELRKWRPAPPFRKSGITGNTSDDPILQHSSSGEPGNLEQMITDELSYLRGQLHELPGSLRRESVTHSAVPHSLRPDSGPSGSSVHGIHQARILEQAAISFSRGPSQPRKDRGSNVHLLNCWNKPIIYQNAG